MLREIPESEVAEILNPSKQPNEASNKPTSFKTHARNFLYSTAVPFGLKSLTIGWGLLKNGTLFLYSSASWIIAQCIKQWPQYKKSEKVAQEGSTEQKAKLLNSVTQPSDRSVDGWEDVPMNYDTDDKPKQNGEVLGNWTFLRARRNIIKKDESTNDGITSKSVVGHHTKKAVANPSGNRGCIVQ
jgi:hypothetical protein